MASTGGSQDVEAIELRVHGVSGTTPEALLDRPLVDQVAGDAIAGFYRPRLAEERHDDAPGRQAPRQPDAPLLEGYNWGGLTSGSPGRAFWLLLLPFTLINIAPRGRPEVARDGRLTRCIWGLARLLALCLTLLLVLAAAGIGIDLYGWQCLRTDVCTDAEPQWVFSRLIGSWEDGQRTGGVSLGAGLLVGALVPALVLGALWLLSRRTLNRYEAVDANLGPGPEPSHGTESGVDHAADAVEVSLSSTHMWRNQVPVRRIRAMHMQSGLAAVIISLSIPIRHSVDLLPRGTDAGAAWWPVALVSFSAWIAALVGAVVIGYGVVVLCLPSYVGWNQRPRYEQISHTIWVIEALAGLALAVSLMFTDVVADAGASARPGGRRSSVNPLPGYDLALLWLLTAMFVLLVALVVVVAAAAAGRRQQARPADSGQDALSTGLGGYGTAALAAFGVLLGAVYSAATYSYAAAWLNSGSVKPTRPEVTHALEGFQLPNAFGVAMLTFLAALIVSVVALVLFVSRLALGYFLRRDLGRPVVRRDAVMVVMQRDYGEEALSDGDDPRSRRTSVERAHYIGSLVEQVPVVIAILVVSGSALTLVAGGLLVSADLFHIGFADDGIHWLLNSDNHGLTTSASYQAWGAYAAVVTLLALVALSAAAFRVPQTRKAVGIVWDVASFWPRTCHPLAAPCYAERAVPDLVTRLRHLRGPDRSRRVVLAGHSQGSVLSAAALLHLRGEDTKRSRMISGIALLTFGCVLRRLYARYFPAYFGVDRLADLEHVLTQHTVPRWRNLWRYTDYLGGQVTQGPPQVAPPGEAVRGAGPPTTPPTTAPLVGDDPHGWEWHAPDPPFFDRVPGSTAFSRPERHSNFWRDPSGIYQLAVVSLDRQLQDEAEDG